MWAHTYQLWLLVWHSSFMLGGLSALFPVALVDYLAFRHFQNFHEFAEYQWNTALWRWTQAIIGGGLAATLFRGMVGAN